MFKILIALIVAGQPHILTSNASFKTKEACEQVRTSNDATDVATPAGVKAALTAQGVEIEGMDSTCEVDDGAPKNPA